MVRKYDPVEALAGLKLALGNNASQKRRKEALIWAYQVWRAAGTRLEDELPEADLHVPTLSGWHPAKLATFSSSWTPAGRTLENFLIEAAEVSSDCRGARDLLLVGQKDWPISAQDAKRNWRQFLELIGVADGLRPVPANLKRMGSPRYLWDHVLRNGRAAEGLDQDWCDYAARVSFNHPYTSYRMKGEAWRVPGQIEHKTLSESASEALCILLFEHLKAHGTSFFEFEIGRFERNEREWNVQILPTPLATFLRSSAWIAATTQEGIAFRRPKECWASRARRGGPPRFVDRVPEQMADFLDADALAELAFSEALGLRDWQSQGTAIDRLHDLAKVAVGLASNDRPTLRREYQRAWLDVVETGVTLPGDLCLIVTRRGQLEVLSGDPDTPAAVIITENAQRFEARVLSSAGQAVLEVGPTPTDIVATLLEQTHAFAPRRLDGIGVQLLVDGEPFITSVNDPLLSSIGLEWLPEVIVIGHELRGEQLERGIQSSTVDRRARAIRVRHCTTMALVVDDQEVSPIEHLRWYTYENDELPTIILTDDLVLDWITLARLLSGGISRLIDVRIRSLEPLLLRLALDRSSDKLDAPSDEQLARALECDVQTVQDHRAALQTDLEHILRLLVPVVAYYGGIELSRQLQGDADRAGAKFNARKWLDVHFCGHECLSGELVEACEQVTNLTELRRHLDLEFERFNRVLLELGEASLSNEVELRQLYEAYLGRMRPTIIERLRRHYVSDFYGGNDLKNYVERKSLSFLAFDNEWVLTRETLEMDIVEAHISKLLSTFLGDDVSVELMPYKQVVEANRKSVREFVLEAMPVVRAWCRQNNASFPEPWKQGETQTVVRQLENSGHLDFAVIKAEEMPVICHRATCWPDRMPKTIDGKTLGVKENDVNEERTRHEREIQQREIDRRSIQFAGHSLDTGDPMFADNLHVLAASWLAKDDTWFNRSQHRIRLMEYENPDRSTSRDGDGEKRGRKSRRERQLTDTQRQAMGLTSEWLAFQYLRRRHGEFVDETCWISENRAQFFSGDNGNDSAGFDFRVKTPQAEWLYEVKSTLEDSGEFELTENELSVASGACKDGRRRYRILYVPYVFSPEKWCVLELPNPMGETTRNRFKRVGRGSIRLRFERR